MGSGSTRSARRLGVASAVGVVSLGIAYLACLVVGLATLSSLQDPIADPWFTALVLGNAWFVRRGWIPERRSGSCASRWAPVLYQN